MMNGLREVTRCFRQMSVSQLSRPTYQLAIRRCASTQAQDGAATGSQSSSPALEDLESNSSTSTPGFGEGVFLRSPKDRFFRRKQQLPGSRYQYHPPKYYRGPLHPIQSPLSSDPVARDFVPGPFNLPRLRQTFDTTVSSDLLTLTYMHKPPGTLQPSRDWWAERLRGWDGSSPYHKNRALRGPRGASASRYEEGDITFRTIPEIEEVTLATYVPLASKNEGYLWVAAAMLQAISGTVPEITKNRINVGEWGVTAGKSSGAKVTIKGNLAYEFLDKCVNLVFPRIKEWPGIKGSSGDSAGNIAWGFVPQDMALFPEVETNYSMYPPKMLPGCRVFVKTSATSNRHARLLLQSLGVPFYGELS